MLEEVAVLSLATSAASILVVKSKVAEGLRQWFSRRGVTVECVFCASFWIAAVLTGFVFPGPLLAPLYVLAAVGGAALINHFVLAEVTTYEEVEDQED